MIKCPPWDFLTHQGSAAFRPLSCLLLRFVLYLFILSNSLPLLFAFLFLSPSLASSPYVCQSVDVLEYVHLLQILLAKKLDPLELPIQAYLNHLTWVLGTKQGFFGGEASVLHCWMNTVALRLVFKDNLFGLRYFNSLLEWCHAQHESIWQSKHLHSAWLGGPEEFYV